MKINNILEVFSQIQKLKYRSFNFLIISLFFSKSNNELYIDTMNLYKEFIKNTYRLNYYYNYFISAINCDINNEWINSKELKSISDVIKNIIIKINNQNNIFQNLNNCKTRNIFLNSNQYLSLKKSFLVEAKKELLDFTTDFWINLKLWLSHHKNELIILEKNIEKQIQETNVEKWKWTLELIDFSLLKHLDTIENYYK